MKLTESVAVSQPNLLHRAVKIKSKEINQPKAPLRKGRTEMKIMISHTSTVSLFGL